MVVGSGGRRRPDAGCYDLNPKAAGEFPSDVDADHRAETADEKGPRKTEGLRQIPRDVTQERGADEDQEFHDGAKAMRGFSEATV